MKKVVVLFAACVFAATVIIAAVHIRRYRDAQQVPPDAEKIARTVSVDFIRRSERLRLWIGPQDRTLATLARAS